MLRSVNNHGTRNYHYRYEVIPYIKSLTGIQDMLYMPQCVHLPLMIMTQYIGSVLFVVSKNLLLPIYHMKKPKVILICGT